MKRAALPLADDLTFWDYARQSADRACELAYMFDLPRPGEQSELRDRLESLGGVPAADADAFRMLAVHLFRMYHPDGKAVRKQPGPKPRYGRMELLNMVAAYMAKTEQCQTAALDDLFGVNADRPDDTVRRRFYNIKKEYSKKWKAVLSSHTACG